mmetsp:Transcript_21988/g.44133  ORF Transcript_21988/g.44133 Transcript_21988/m.44133 type:complete len:202 (-) Transcript_21988:216-821(-)
MMVGHAHVVVENRGISAPGRKNVVIPGQRTDARSMSRHRSELLLLVDIPDLNVLASCSHSKIMTVFHKLDRSDDIVFIGRFAQQVNRAGCCIPEVNARAETNRKRVLARPAENVDVIVINKVRCVEDALRRGIDMTELAANANGFPVRGVKNAQLVMVRFGGLGRLVAIRKNLRTAVLQNGLSDHRVELLVLFLVIAINAH